MRGVGLYIGRSHVVGVVLVRSGAGFRLKQYAVEPIQEIASEVDAEVNTDHSKKISPESTAIRVVMEKMHVKGAFVRAAISPYHIVTRYFFMPALPEKEKDEVVQYEASRITRLKLTESYFGYNENIRVKNVSTITVNAVKKRVIQSTVMNLRRGSAEVAAIEPDYVPLSRACAHFGFSDYKKTHILIWFDSDLSVGVTLASKGMIFLSQDFRLSGDTAQDREKIHDELQGSMRFLNENAGGAQPEIVFLSGFGNLEGWTESIHQSFPSMDVRVMRVPESNEVDQALSGGLVLAFGLALGDLGLKSPLGEVTLLPAEEMKIRPTFFLSILAAVGATVSVVFFAIFIFIFSPIEHTLDRKRQESEVPLASHGAVSAGTAEELEMRAGELAKKSKNLKQFEKASASMKDVLLDLQDLPKTIWLIQIVLEASGQGSQAASQPGSTVGMRLVLQGYCFAGDSSEETKQVNEWAQKLARAPGFASRFPHLSVDEIKQQKIAGRGVSHFILMAEA